MHLKKKLNIFFIFLNFKMTGVATSLQEEDGRLRSRPLCISLNCRALHRGASKKVGSNRSNKNGTNLQWGCCSTDVKSHVEVIIVKSFHGVLQKIDLYLFPGWNFLVYQMSPVLRHTCMCLETSQGLEP